MEKTKKNLEVIKVWILVIAPLILGGVSIYFLFHNNGNLTQRELNLITGLQFISSIWFGWVISSIFSEQEFQQRQKKFAISAYRRIKEIEITLERLLNRLASKMSRNQTLNKELDVIKEMALSLKTTTRSSKADWADIIGEEIKTLEKIEGVEREERTEGVEREERTELAPIDDNQSRTEKLLKKLPPSLEIQAREMNRDRINNGIKKLETELSDVSYIEFDGFWDHTFEKDIFSIPVGSTVFVSVDDIAGRVGTLIAHSDSGEALGVITNKGLGSASYSEFVEMVIGALEKSKFSAKYVTRGHVYLPRKIRDNERHYFKIRVEK